MIRVQQQFDFSVHFSTIHFLDLSNVSFSDPPSLNPGAYLPPAQPVAIGNPIHSFSIGPTGYRGDPAH